ncbi:MAG: hypothetical protein M1825_002446 [Sarcosagium campestre]|nr:MAG: hypothetical protein M1825_002446 [Sarcosagium campestre]
MANITASSSLPPLPGYHLQPLPSLLPPIPDKVLTLLLPVAAYWLFSLFFHFIDTYDYLPQYRLHTPVEVLKRNRVSRWEVVRDVVVQQILQTAMGIVLGMTEPDDMIGKEEYDIVRWAQRLRLTQAFVPRLLSLVGINGFELANKVDLSYPIFAGLLRGGNYAFLHQTISMGTDGIITVPVFAAWELYAARALYWFLIPALQFGLGILVVDTWQYFLHRAMHMNQWLYRTFHSRHHRLYVPYAYGALYNHPLEGFVLDILGTTVAFKVAGMTTRQGMWFFTGSTFKTVDDHCGYSLPWDPFQLLTSNNAGYHDIHHQSWGIKTNFSQPFFTFWDRLLGTKWTGGDVSARYERARIAAQRKSEMDDQKSKVAPQSIAEGDKNDILDITGKAAAQAAASRDQVLHDFENGGQRVIVEEAREEQEAKRVIKRESRKKTSSSTPQTGSLKNLRERVNGSLHGRSGGMLGVESSR